MKMTMKKKILTTLSVVLILGMAALGILAYLQSEDSDVNVMTLGNVQIEQHEYERVQNADGAYEMVTTASGTGYKLKEFTQAKPLYPGVGSITGWDGVVWADQLGTSKGGQYILGGMENVIDKFVSVENTGKSDAYVRTIIAFEQGEMTYEKFDNLVMLNINDTGWEMRNVGTALIDNNNYFIVEFIYQDSRITGEAGVVPAGAFTSFPLGQVYLKPETTNEDCESLDGNNNGTYDILVFSQAVQTEGFADAQTALDTAFGDITVALHPWVENTPGTIVNTPEELDTAISNGGKITLGKDITIEKLNINKESALDLNNCALTVTELNISEDAKVYNGTLEHGPINYEDKYDFNYEENSAIYVNKGNVTFDDVVINCEVPCTLKIKNNSTIELVGIHVDGGNVTFNNTNLMIKNDRVYGNLIQYETLIGVCLDKGTFTMNNSKLSLNGLGGRDSTDYLGVVARTDAVKNVNLANSSIVNSHIYVVSMKSNTTVNTTDSEEAWAGKYAGNMTINFNR